MQIFKCLIQAKTHNQTIFFADFKRAGYNVEGFYFLYRYSDFFTLYYLYRSFAVHAGDCEKRPDSITQIIYSKRTLNTKRPPTYFNLVLHSMSMPSSATQHLRGARADFDFLSHVSFAEKGGVLDTQRMGFNLL